jgi:RNA polymerase sigma factor (sigma-70 family)
MSMATQSTLDQLTDRDLIDACQKGSEPAWGEFVNRFGRLVYAAARRRGLSDADAEEVLQHTFEMAWRNIDQLRDADAVRGWLLTTAMRQCWRIGRASAKTPVSVESVDEPREEDADRLQQWEHQDLVRRALTQLGEPCKALLIAIFRQGQGERYAEVAAQLGLPIGSIGPTRGRCFRKLEDILGRMGYAP